MSKRTKWLLAIGVIATLIVGWQIAAFAVVEESGFEDDDGNLAVNTAGNMDWNGFAPTTWTGTAPNRTATDSAGGWEFDGIEDAQATTSDDGFAGGTKQDAECAKVITAKAPNKDDLRRVYFSNATVGGHVYLNLGWVRIPQNTTSPSAHIAFEFNQSETPCGSGSGDLVERSTANGGDVLIVYDFEGGATDTPTIRLSRWIDTGTCEVASNSPPCWGVAQELGPGVAEARVNTSAVGPVSDAIHPNAPPAQTLGLNEFGEAEIDLTDAGVFPEGECRSFGNAFAVSRTSGSSSTAQMKDLVGPGDVDIKNCGRIIINKETVPSPDPTDTSFNFDATGGLDPVTFDLKDGESQDYGDQVLAGNYDVTEDLANTPGGANFALTDISCTVTGGNGSVATPNLANKTVDIELKAEDTVECTFENTLQVGALEILKNSTKGGPVSQAGAVFSYNGPSGTASVTDNGTGDENPAVGEVCVSGLLQGSYDIEETSAPPGYGLPVDSTDTATVVAGSNCTDSPPSGEAVVTFTDPPLADIQVNFRDGGSGETSTVEDITCTVPNGSGNGSNTPVATGWDESRTVTGIRIDPSPQEIQCTIEIDP